MATELFQMSENVISASTTDVNLTPIIPNGVTVRIQVFGGSDLGQAGNYYALQWGSASTWQTIRAAGGTIEIPLNRAFKGDGVKRFRVIRVNEQASPKRIVVWVQGYIEN